MHSEINLRRDFDLSTNRPGLKTIWFIECTDQIETCPSAAVQNRCQTLAKICCATCKIYFANKTAEIELEQEREQSNSFSIGSSMTLKPASPERQATINGGALAGDFVISTEPADETEPGTFLSFFLVVDFHKQQAVFI